MITYAALHNEYLTCKEEIDKAIAKVIANSNFINGEAVDKFEEQFAKYTKSEASSGTSSGTSALMLALASLDVGINDEVIVPTMSFISTAEVVSQLKAIPVFVDIDDYYTLDLTKVKEKITSSTKAIIFVDLYGQTVDIENLYNIAKGIPLIRDAAQSTGCVYLKDDASKYVYASCYSFYPGKNLSAMGDAGAVTGSKEVCNKIKMLGDHGRLEKYTHLTVGWCERLDALQASILSVKLNKIDIWNHKRQENAQFYFNNLNTNKILLPKINSCSTHVFNQFVISCNKRDELKKFLYANGIESGIQFPIPMHKQPVYNSPISLPKSEKLAINCLSLPIHPYLTMDDLEKVSSTISNFYALD